MILTQVTKNNGKDVTHTCVGKGVVDAVPVSAAFYRVG